MKQLEPSIFESNLRWNSFVSHKYKLIYVATPKVACTTLKWWFAALEGLTQQVLTDTRSMETDPDLVIHDLFPLIAPQINGLPADKLRNLFSSDDYFRFALVRNPYTRVFSAWQSKILLQEPLQIAPYRDFEFIHHPIESAADIAGAFEAFLEHVATHEAPHFWDVHWTPQVALLYPGHVKYTMLSQVENLTALRGALAKYLGPGMPDALPKRRANESLIPYMSTFVTERSRALICSLYAADFSTFKYSTSPPKSARDLSNVELHLALQATRLIRGRNQRLYEIRAASQQKVATLEESVEALTLIDKDRERHIKSLVETLSVQAQQAITLTEAISDQGAQMLKMSQAVDARDSQIAALKSLLEQKDNHVGSLSQDLMQLEKHQAAAKQELFERDEQLARLHTTAADAEARIRELGESVSTGERTIASLEQAAKLHSEAFAALQRELLTISTRLEVCSQLLDYSRARIIQIEGSRSWHVTKPFRVVTGLGYKLRWSLVRFRAVLRDEGPFIAARRSWRFISGRLRRRFLGTRIGLSADSRTANAQAVDQQLVDQIPTELQHDDIVSPARHVVMFVENFFDGGVERVVIDLCLALRRRGYVTLIAIAGSGGRSADEARRLGIEVYEFKHDRELFGSFVETLNEAVVLAHHCYFELEMLAIKQVPVIEVLHNAYHWQLGNEHVAMLRRSYLVGYISVSSFVTNYANRYLDIPLEKIKQINNGMNHEGMIRPPLKLLREQRLKTVATPRFLHVANLHPQKNHVLVVQAFSRLKRVYPTAELIMAGAMDGYPELAQMLHSDIETLGLASSVRITGALDRRSLSRLMAEAHVALLPSQFEGFSIATLEFSFFGLPAILSATGAAKELADSYGHVLISTDCATPEDKLDVGTIAQHAGKPRSEAIANLSRDMQSVLDNYSEWLERAIAAASRHTDYSIDHAACDYDCYLDAVMRA